MLVGQHREWAHQQRACAPVRHPRRDQAQGLLHEAHHPARPPLPLAQRDLLQRHRQRRGVVRGRLALAAPGRLRHMRQPPTQEAE
eukprot:646265-Alexandrium_andersonii.AAC.1